MPCSIRPLMSIAFRFLAAVVLSLVCLAAPALASDQVQTFTATHTYVLGDDDSRNSARQKCLAEAKRKILEQIGVYLESHSELLTSAQSGATGSTKSSQTTYEERQQITERITTLAAGIMKTEVVKEEFGDVNGRLHMTLTVKAHVDPDDIQRQLAAKRADQGVRKQVAEQQQRIEELENQLRAMMKEMRTAGGSERRGSEQQERTDVIPDVVTIREEARKGDANAQADLGWMYLDGEGAPQDSAQAVIWLRKAAEQGDAVGQVELGKMYASGEGVPQDEKVGIEWIRKAAEQPDEAIGKDSLGVMYRDGRGVPRDNIRAYMWFDLAFQSYHQQGGDSKSTLKRQVEIAEQLNSAQITEAKRLAQKCQAQGFKGC